MFALSVKKSRVRPAGLSEPEAGRVLPDVLAQGEIAAVCVTSDATGKMIAQPIPAEVKAKLEPAAPAAYTL